MPSRSGAETSSAGSAPKVVVVRGTRAANITELGIYARLRDHGLAPSLLGARSTTYRDAEVGMPVARLPTPRLAGSISRTAAGGYAIGRVSAYRYFHEYLEGLPEAVRGAAVLAPTDLGHPTSYQCLRARGEAKLLVQVWDNIPFNWPHDRPLSAHYEAVLDGADHFLPLTRDADRALRLQGVVRERRTHIYPGIDLEEFRPPTAAERKGARAAAQLGPDEVAVTFVGRVEFYKGIFTLLEALVDADARVRLLVVGDGSSLARARWRARKLGVEPRVTFWGTVPHVDLLRKVLWATDVVAVPSIPNEQWREQFAQVFLEAAAAGAPTLGTRCGAVPEVIHHGTTGLLVPPDHPVELQEALDRLAGDAALRAKLGGAGRTEAEQRFDVRPNARALANLIHHRLLEGSPRTSS